MRSISSEYALHREKDPWLAKYGWPYEPLRVYHPIFSILTDLMTGATMVITGPFNETERDTRSKYGCITYESYQADDRMTEVSVIEKAIAVSFGSIPEVIMVFQYIVHDGLIISTVVKSDDKAIRYRIYELQRGIYDLFPSIKIEFSIDIQNNNDVAERIPAGASIIFKR